MADVEATMQAGTGWLGCVVCGDDGQFVALAAHAAETEVMCARCGQARLVPVLGERTATRTQGAARSA